MRFDPSFPYATPRLRLVPVEDRHADALWAWTRDPRFNAYMLWPQPKIPLQVKRIVDKQLEAWHGGTAFSYFCEAKDDGATIARVEARRSPRRASIGEIGVFIAAHAWNRGLGTELTHFGLWFCFENLELEAVAIDAAIASPAANHLLMRLGLHPLGEQRYPLADGGAARLNRFVITRDEFQVRIQPVMAGFSLPTEASLRLAERRPIVAPVGTIGIVKAAAAANAELL